jgi:hypothetical protein
MTISLLEGFLSPREEGWGTGASPQLMIVTKLFLIIPLLGPGKVLLFLAVHSRDYGISIAILSMQPTRGSKTAKYTMMSV